MNDDKLTVRIPRELREKIRKLARKWMRTEADVVRLILLRHLGNS